MYSSEGKFVPKQALQPSPALYDELVGDTTEQLANALLAEIPSIPDSSVFHDNGCGTGAATAAVFKAAAEAQIQVTIKGTDASKQVLERYKAISAANGWPTEALEMDATKLSFPDNTFTHSIMNALIFVLPNDGLDAVKEAYRTLKPGGTLLVNVWTTLPSLGSVNHAAKATRPEGTPLPLDDPRIRWGGDGEYLQEVVAKGGFDKDKIKTASADVYTTTAELGHFAKMNWSYMGGLGKAGWLKSDESTWDEAVKHVEDYLRRTDGFEEVGGGKGKVKFATRIVVATK